MIDLEEWEWADIEAALSYLPKGVGMVSLVDERLQFRESISHVIEIAQAHQVRLLRASMPLKRRKKGVPHG